jgi:hypothetical protein
MGLLIDEEEGCHGCQEAGCQAHKHFSPGERFAVSKKRVVRPVSISLQVRDLFC